MHSFLLLKDKTNDNLISCFRSLTMNGKDVMLARVNYYQSVAFEDLEKLVKLSDGIPKSLRSPPFM